MKKVLVIMLSCFIILSQIVFGEIAYVTDRPLNGNSIMPETPKISDPYYGETVEYADVYVNWNTCNNASYYLLRLTVEETNQVILNNVDTASSSMIISKNDLKAGQHYKVEVASVNGDEKAWHTSYFSVEQSSSMERPEISTPDANEKVELRDLKVNWSSVKNVDYYLFSLENLSEDTFIVSEEKITSANYSVKASDLVANHEYKISVVAVKDSEQVRDDSYFQVKNNQVESPEIIEPVLNEEVMLGDVKIDWLGVDSKDHYLISLINITTDDIIINRQQVSNSSYYIRKDELEAGYEYKVSVAAVKDNKTKWSETYFYVATDKAETPKISEPSNNAVVNYESLKIDWNKCDNAYYYRISLTDLTDDKQIIKNRWLTKHFYEIEQADLTPGHDYFVEVMSIAYREKLGKSDKLRFSVESTNVVEAEFVNISDVYGPEDILIKWSSVDADNYILSLYDMTEESQVFEKYTTNDTTYTLSEKKIDLNHTYRVSLAAVYGDIEEWIDHEFVVTNVALIHPDEILMGEPITINWKNNIEKEIKDYNLNIIYNNQIIFDKDDIKESSLVIDSGFFQHVGTYYIDLYVNYKDGTSSKSASKLRVSTSISPWAKHFVEAVESYQLLEIEFMNTLLEEPQATLTRTEFCMMLIGLYDSFENTHMKLDLDKAKTFTDISSLSSTERDAILKANALGIISGVSDFEFNPSGSVTRQEMAVMLKNTYIAVVGNDLLDEEWNDSFEDKDKIDSWAVSSVKFTNRMNILNGDGMRFKPKEVATHEMGFVLLEKSYKVMKKELKK